MRNSQECRWQPAIPPTVTTGLALALALACALTGAPTSHAAPQLNDASITNAIDSELLVDDVAPFNSIDVQTTDGIVTLSGTVYNVLAKERAAKLARAVRGTRSVINTISVEPSDSLSDAEIAANVEQALAEDPATDSYEVTTSVQDGMVNLDGEVESWQEKALVETVAKSVRGVRGVNDTIAVTYRADRPDSEIQHEIEQALKWNALVDDALIDVSVDKGAVTLSGTVGSAAEANRALLEAWVAGVESVSNENLTVERWARDDDLRENKYGSKSDEAIRDAIQDALAYDPRVMSFNVESTVSNGLVTLTGTVDNLKAKRAAERVARETVGVMNINNLLKVRPEPVLADASVETNIEHALARDPFVDRYEIDVNAINGKAYLSGTVDSFYEKSRADDAASRAAGVTEVENDLIVDDDYAPLSYDPHVDEWYPYDDSWYDYEPSQPATNDTNIKDSIESEMWWSPFVDSDEVNVDVDNGEATLTGSVDSWSEFQSAQENAYEGGATWVDNDLVISGS